MSNGTGSGTAGQVVGQESSLSNWAGPYVTDMLGRGAGLADQGYQAYTGPLTAGTSALQNQAFSGLANLAMPTAQQTTFNPMSFTQPGTSQQFMNPYIQSAIQPQIAELTRQSQIQRENTRSELAKAGAFGGSRQAIMEAELNRNLNDQIAQTIGQEYRNAYNQAANQFNTEQGMRFQAAQNAQNYGLQGLGALLQAGQAQRDIEQQGITADYGQFKEERQFPYQQVQFMQSLLQGLPIGAQSYSRTEPSSMNQLMSTIGGILSLFNQGGGSSGDNSSGDTSGGN